MKQKFLFSLVLVSILVWINPVQATLVRPINIKQLTHLAQYIVKATVTNKSTEYDEYESGKMVVYYTLKVLDWRKGKPWDGKNEIIIKQLSSGDYNTGGSIVRQNLSIPQYEVGKTYVFFLPNPHPVSGLLAPIGLAQGLFTVEKDSSGNDIVPELQERSAFLKKGLNTSKSSGAFLKKKLENKESIDTSYENFKVLIDSANESE